MTAFENVRRQIVAELAMMGYAFSADAGLNQRAIDELARIIAGAGIDDIRNIAQFDGSASASMSDICTTVERGDSSDLVCVPAPPQSFPETWFYDRISNRRLAVGQPGSVEYYYEGDNGPFRRWNPADANFGIFAIGNLGERWFATYHVRFTDSGIPYFFAEVWRQDSGWIRLRKGVIFVASAIAMGIPGMGAAIGQFVFPSSFVSAYPAVVNVAMNTAFNAVLGGQDIEHAIGRALASYAGAGFGDIVGGQFDSATIARLTGAATTAALNGSDVEMAVGVALLQSGAALANVAPVPAPVAAPAIVEGPAMDEFDLFPSNAYTFDTGEPVFSANYTDEFGTIASDPYGAFLGAELSPIDQTNIDLGIESVFGSTDFGSINESGTTIFSGGGSGDFGTVATSPPPSPTDTGSGWDWDKTIATVSKAALAALQLSKVYQSSSTPAPKTGAATQTVNRNGTITTTAPTGQRTTAKLPTGTPYVLPDGSLIMNNGDGTYTLTSPSGVTSKGTYSDSATIYPFPGASGGIDAQTAMLLAALGVGAFFMLRKGR